MKYGKCFYQKRKGNKMSGILRMSEDRVRLFGRNGNGLVRNFTYNSNSNTNNNNVGNIRRRLFNDNNEGPKSPPKAPKKVNVSKYEKMLKNLENKNKNKNAKNNKPNNENKNVVSWLNSSMADAKKSKIPKNKRVFLITDMTNNGKIKQVWDRRFLNGLVESYETRYNRVREANDPFFTSPLTRKKFSKNDIKAYPPTNTTKKIIKQIMNRRVLIAEVNKIIKIKNRDNYARSNILETIKRGVRNGTITTEKQIKELALIYKVTGRELLISGHKRDGDYYTAYVEGKFKPHHMKFMKDAPSMVALLYDTTLHVEPRAPARAITPLYKLPSAVIKYLSQFNKYLARDFPLSTKDKTFIMRVLRRVVFTGYINHDRDSVMKEISTFKNANLRNELSEYYDWHETVKNAAS